MSNDSLATNLSKSGKNAASAAAETFHDTGAAARTTAKDLGALADAVKSDTSDGVRQLTHLVEDESSKVVKYVRESVQERPNLTVGVAAGIGVFIGMMLAGRR